jgi:hypothetical protein
MIRFIFPTAILLSACLPVRLGPTSIYSGIEGQVLIGPTCAGPVRVESNCEDQPYQTTLTVTSPKGERIVQIKTDEEGRFKVPLVAGVYILHPESPNTLPFAGEQRVTVEEGKFTQVIVNYNSGIR